MNHIREALSYSFNRNIGWQDRTIRSILGIVCLTTAVFLYSENFVASVILVGIFLAQVVTVSSSRCIICYFLGKCTIMKSEKETLKSKGIPYQE